jgi:hypothetical protein
MVMPYVGLLDSAAMQGEAVVVVVVVVAEPTAVTS